MNSQLSCNGHHRHSIIRWHIIQKHGANSPPISDFTTADDVFMVIWSHEVWNQGVAMIVNKRYCALRMTLRHGCHSIPVWEWLSIKMTLVRKCCIAPEEQVCTLHLCMVASVITVQMCARMVKCDTCCKALWVVGERKALCKCKCESSVRTFPPGSSPGRTKVWFAGRWAAAES